MANPVCEVLLSEEILQLPQRPVDTRAGAIVDFQGVVRGREDDREISGIEYEAHRAMAQHQLQLIAGKAVGQFGLRRLIIHHRIGFVPAGETSLLLQVAAGHRAEAFRASEWIIDELKRKVPIWKHPRFRTEEPRLEQAVEIART